MRSASLWALINRCVVCGSKLIFTRSPKRGCSPEEGTQECRTNHAPFRIYGFRDADGYWHTKVYLPKPGARRVVD